MSKEFTFRYDPVDNDNYEACVVASDVEHITKSDDGELTNIHLRSGRILVSRDSMNTLEARLNSALRSQHD